MDRVYGEVISKPKKEASSSSGGDDGCCAGCALMILAAVIVVSSFVLYFKLDSIQNAIVGETNASVSND